MRAVVPTAREAARKEYLGVTARILRQESTVDQTKSRRGLPIAVVAAIIVGGCAIIAKLIDVFVTDRSVTTQVVETENAAARELEVRLAEQLGPAELITITPCEERKNSLLPGFSSWKTKFEQGIYEFDVVKDWQQAVKHFKRALREPFFLNPKNDDRISRCKQQTLNNLGAAFLRFAESSGVDDPQRELIRARADLSAARILLPGTTDAALVRNYLRATLATGDALATAETIATLAGMPGRAQDVGAKVPSGSSLSISGSPSGRLQDTVDTSALSAAGNHSEHPQ